MSVQRIYSCNLCRDRIGLCHLTKEGKGDVGEGREGAGIHFGQEHTIVFRPLASVENHLCLRCIGSLCVTWPKIQTQS